MLDISRYTVITGHYGSGKTNFAVNLAVDLRSQGKEVIVVDLDIVNPYFRTADFSSLFSELGIKLIAPPFANSNVDIPVITAEVFSVFEQSDAYVIFDVGGDDAGAVALGAFKRYFESCGGYQMYYLVNCFRFLTKTAAEACELLYDIEAASRLKATAVVNNSNLARITTSANVESSVGFANEVSNILGIPLVCHAVVRELAEELCQKYDSIYPVDIYVKTIWE